MKHLQRVRDSSLGWGTVIGFEVFKKDGWPDKPVTEDPGSGRVIVQLDDSTKWRPTQMTPHPYCMRHDLTIIPPNEDHP